MTNTKIEYDSKAWNGNDVVTSEDMNRIENGISDVTAYAQNLNGEAVSELASLKNKLAIQSETDSDLQAQLDALKQTVANNKTELENKISNLHKDVITQSNLKTAIAPLLVTDSTTHLSINGGSLTLEKKNTSRNVIQYAYYKRTSTAEVYISQPVSFPSERYSMWKYKTFTLATLGEGTSDMTDADLARFGYLSKSSGTGSTSIRFYIQDGKLMAQVGLLGGGLISVNFEGTISFRSYNDTNYTIY